MAQSADSQLRLHLRMWEAEAGRSLSQPGLRRDFLASRGYTVKTPSPKKEKRTECLKSTLYNGLRSKRRARHKEIGGYRVAWVVLFAGVPQEVRRTTVCGCVPCFSPWIPDSKQTLTKDSTELLLIRSLTKVLTFSGPPIICG